MFRNKFILLLLLIVPGAILSAEKIVSPVEVEKNLRTNLRGIVSEDLFQIFVSVDSRKKRVKIPLKTSSVSKGKEHTKSDVVPGLPGFDDPGTNKKKAAKVVEKAKSFRYETVVIYSNPVVRMIIDSSVPDETVSIMTNVVSDRMRMSFNKKPRIVLDRMEHLKRPEAKSLDAAGYIKKFGYENINKLLKFLGSLLIVAMIFFYLLKILREYLKAKFRLKEMGLKKEMSKEDDDRSSEIIQEAMSQVVSVMKNDPMVMADFLRTLTDEQAAVVYSCQQTNALRHLMAIQLRRPESSLRQLVSEIVDVEKKAPEIMSQLKRDLDHFEEVHKAVKVRSFGFLSLLSGHSIAKLLTPSNFVKELATLLPFLSASQSKDVLAGLSVEEKAELVLSSRNPPSSEDVATLESSMKIAYQEKGAMLHAAGEDTDGILGGLLDSQPDPRDILKALARSGFEVPPRFQSYGVGPIEVLQLPKEELVDVLSEISNEDIAAVLCKFPEAEVGVSNAIGTIRSKIVNSMLKTNVPKPEDIDIAVGELLKKYRHNSNQKLVKIEG